MIERHFVLNVAGTPVNKATEDCENKLPTVSMV